MSPGGTSLEQVLSVIEATDDVAAALESRKIGNGPELLRELKGEVDRALYSDVAHSRRVASAVYWFAARLGDPVSKAWADASRARLLHAEGRYEEAEALYVKAASAFRTEGMALDAAALAKQRMAALMYLGRYEEAFALGRDSRRTLRRHGDLRLLAQHDTNFGSLYYHVDRYRPALAAFERARSIFRELGDDGALAHVEHNCAAVLTELDRYAEAVALYESAAAHYRAAGALALATHADLAIAFIEYLRGHYHEALRRFADAERVAAPEINDIDRALTDRDMAELLLRLNATGEARDRAERAVSRFEQARMPNELARSLRLQAVASARRGDTGAARALLHRALELFEREGNRVQAAISRTHLADVALVDADVATALDAASAAEGVFRRLQLRRYTKLARMLRARALLLAGDHGAAARLARALLRGAEPWVAYQAHQVVAEAARVRGRIREAVSAYRSAIDTLEDLRGCIVVDQYRCQFLEDKVSLFEGAIQSCLAERTSASIADAFRTLEQAKSRSLADLLTDYLRECAPGSEEGRSARERFQRLLDEIAWYTARRDQQQEAAGEGPECDGARRKAVRQSRELAAREAELAEAFRDLQLSDARYAELQRPNVATAEEIARLLGPNEALVEFMCVNGRFSAFVVTNDSVEVSEQLASVDEIKTLLAGLQFQMDKFRYGRPFVERQASHLRWGADAYLARLNEALIRPLVPLLGKRELVFVPHGLLHYVPFHALLGEDGYLVERHEVSYAPSATVYALCQRANRNASGPEFICGLADATAPEIEREIAALQTLFPLAHIRTGAAATRASLFELGPRARLLHLASHARFRSDNPLFSSLQLADGDLTFYDVFGLRLVADLVVLSGCNTGAVAVSGGDELHGLMRGFLYAGAPSLVISMWAADDIATAEIMTRFYSCLRDGMSKRGALTVAQREAFRRFEHPYYWAPFVLLGRAA
jgi:CHAT domain-containing protein